MATLVLGVVGGAVLGPVGAALGSLAGQAVDGLWLKPATQTGARLSDLKVQTSSYGTAVPRVFGTMRVAGCVIWSTDLLESRSTSGGKGQASTTTYSYAASFAVALSGRPVLRVGRIWADGNLLRGAAGDWKSPLGGFRLHPGSEDQMADPLIASAEGALAPAHRGTTYAVFEQLQLAAFGNRIPSLTFELVADEAMPGPWPIAADLSGGVAVGGPDGGPLTGLAADGAARDVLAMLAESAGGWWGPAGDGVALRTGGEDGVVVSDAAIAPSDASATRSRSLAAIESVPRVLTVSHYDPARDWQAGVQSARRPGAGQDEARIELPAALPATAARALAETALMRREADRTTRVVMPGLSALAVAAGDVVRVAGEAGRWRVTEAALERLAVRLTLAPLAPGAAGAMPASAGRVLAAPDLLAGATRLVVAELPPLDDALLTGPRVTVLAAGQGPGWRQASLLYSTDGGARWLEAGGTAAPAIIGTVIAAPGPAPATLIDTGGTIEVELAHAGMILADADSAALEAGANLALVGDELVQFGVAQPLGARRWRLSRLWRGRRGTEATTGTARAGDRFALIERAAAVTIDLPAALVGGTLRVMASGVGDAEPAAVATRLTGVSCCPPAPVHLREARTGDGGATIAWVRRSRIGWQWVDGADAPLGEEAERYRVTWQGRDRLVDLPALSLTPAERAGGGRLEVRQLGTNGDGSSASIDLAADA